MSYIDVTQLTVDHWVYQVFLLEDDPAAPTEEEKSHSLELYWTVNSEQLEY